MFVCLSALRESTVDRLNSVREYLEYLSVLVLPINYRTVSFAFSSLFVRSALYTINSVPFSSLCDLTSYNNSLIHTSGSTKMRAYRL